MILIVDKTVDGRASAFREKLFSLGCPCAVATPATVKDYVPFRLILTYTDVVDEIRRLPYDNVHIVAIGDGFVNSALSAERAVDEEDAVKAAHTHLMREMNIPSRHIMTFGIALPPVLFLSQYFIEINGTTVKPTPTEIMILNYLLGVSSERIPVSAEQIAKYCTPESSVPNISVISVHISHLNTKVRPSYGGRLIRARNGIGYFSEINVNSAMRAPS